jgi:hypothetical protein
MFRGVPDDFGTVMSVTWRCSRGRAELVLVRLCGVRAIPKLPPSACLLSRGMMMLTQRTNSNKLVADGR